MNFGNPDIGEAMRPDQIKAGTVYVLTKDQQTFVTLWCTIVAGCLFSFHAGELNAGVVLMEKDDQLQDNTGAKLTVYEYLGEI